jgi:hypothetical protein
VTIPAPGLRRWNCGHPARLMAPVPAISQPFLFGFIQLGKLDFEHDL